MTAKYKLNGFYYDVKSIDEKNGLIYLMFGNEAVPIRLTDVEDIG